MSSAGHVLDMLNRYRANRQMLTSKGRKKSVAELRSVYLKHYPRGIDPIRNSLSEAELQAIRKEIRLKIKSQRKRGAIITWIISLIIVCFGICLPA